MKVAVTFILIATAVWCCQDKSRIVNSEAYQDEELEVYNQLLDNLLDSIGFEIKGEDTLKQVFYLQDTLSASSYEYLDIKLNDQIFSLAEVTRNSRHRFIRTGDTLKLNDNEIFAREWLTISRVSLDESMSNGVLLLETWCGDLCGAGYRVEIKRIERRWIITKVKMIWVS
jgi:hypothetical protein